MVRKETTTSRLFVFLALVLMMAWAATCTAQLWWQRTTDRWNEIKSEYHLASAELAGTVRSEISGILHKSGLVGGAPIVHSSDHRATAPTQSRPEIRRIVENHRFSFERTLNALKNIEDKYAAEGPDFLIGRISALSANLRTLAANTTMDPARWKAAISAEARQLDFRALQLRRFHMAAYKAANKKLGQEQTLGSYFLYGFLILSFAAALVFAWLIFGRIVRTDRRLRESRARLADAQRIAQLGTWDWDPATNRVLVSEEAAGQFELPTGERVTDLDALLDRVHNADAQAAREKIEVLAALSGSCEFDLRIPCAGGGMRHLHLHGQADSRVGNGAPDLVRFAQLDVTDLIETEAQLRESQKMQVLGQLTGGIAHDFNNILMVVQGNLELAKELCSTDQAVNARIDKAIDGAAKAARLTHQLLAFARNQPLSPKSVNAGEVLHGMSDLLTRTLGETIDVKVVSPTELWNCEVDKTQLENAVLNLVLNARDAMPQGGCVTLETRNVRLDDEFAAAQEDVAPGEYVVLSISDTGSGMADDVRTRVFEPFFTTKSVGQGTGLGLSQVYGFVKQSRGHVSVYSEPGEGTTFRLYLPRAIDEAPAMDAIPDNTGIPNSQGAQTIMVVEDDCDVLTVTVNMLSDLGYKVLGESDPKSALSRLSEGEPVDLLLTDVVLRGDMNGRTLAEKIREFQPGIRVLYMSGYPEHGIVHHGRLDPGLHLLPKPFGKVDLAQQIASLLHQEPGTRESGSYPPKNALSA